MTEAAARVKVLFRVPGDDGDDHIETTRALPRWDEP